MGRSKPRSRRPGRKFLFLLCLVGLGLAVGRLRASRAAGMTAPDHTPAYSPPPPAPPPAPVLADPVVPEPDEESLERLETEAPLTEDAPESDATTTFFDEVLSETRRKRVRKS